MRFLGGLADSPQYDLGPKPGYPVARTGSSSALESPGGAGGEQGVSAEMSVIWMDRWVDNRGAGLGSLHVRVSPVPQGLMSLLDDLG